MLLISEYLKGEKSMAELCRDFSVSRKTAYKWLHRYKVDGPSGLEDRSRAPLAHPRRVMPAIEEALVQARRSHPHWGARKVVAWLERQHPELVFPAASTVNSLFTKYGISKTRQRRQRTPPYTAPFADATEPNLVWCADFKGDFQTGDLRRCYPATITDAFSRMLLKCHALRSTRTELVRPVFERAFREYGMPERIRTDNGAPFASRGAGGLSQLSIWWLKLGIRHERIQPGHPEQNGRHERMHRTLKQETLRPPAGTIRAQQLRFDSFRKEYNQERPHEALGNDSPSAKYSVSTRRYTGRTRSPQYTDECIVRKVSPGGTIGWKGTVVTIGRALRGEWIGIERGDELRHVFFADVRLGFIDDNRPGLGLICPPVTCWTRPK